MRVATVARPTGVTVIAVVIGIGGVILALAGIVVLVGGSFLFGALLGAGGAMAGVVAGVIVLVIAALYLYTAWGAWNLKNWAWVVSLILAALGVLGSLTGLRSAGNWLGLVLNAVVIYFLFTPDVKRAFGRT